MQIMDLVIQHSSFQGSIYNVASHQEITIAEAAQAFLNEFSPEKRLVFNGKVKVGDPNNWLADMENLRKYGFKPQYNLSLGLKKYAEWLRELK
jgi:UDP-glucose 4-epimerase